MNQLSELFEQASAAYRGGDLMEAEGVCQRIIRSHPNSANAWYLLAMIAHDQANHESAAERMDQAVQLAPDDPEYLAHAAEIFRLARRLDDALTAARQAVRLDPQHPATHNNLGMVPQTRGEWDRAESCYRQAIRLDGGYYRAPNNLGNILILQGRLLEAADILREALRRRPNNPQALNAMGIVLQRQRKLGSTTHLTTGVSYGDV